MKYFLLALTLLCVPAMAWATPPTQKSFLSDTQPLCALSETAVDIYRVDIGAGSECQQSVSATAFRLEDPGRQA